MTQEQSGVQRSLPDEQVKVTDADSEEAVDLQTMERAEELSNQYETIKDRTVDSNTVLGLLTDIDTSANNDRIIVTVDLPAEGHDKTFRFRKPKVWANQYQFVRWIRYYDYDADSFPNMLQDECKVKVTKKEGGYDLYIPEQGVEAMNILNHIPRLGSYLKARYVEVGIPISLFALTALVLYAIALGGQLMTLGLRAEQFTALFIICVVILIVVALWEDSKLPNQR